MKLLVATSLSAPAFEKASAATIPISTSFVRSIVSPRFKAGVFQHQECRA
jgi:hypothetical protein